MFTKPINKKCFTCGLEFIAYDPRPNRGKFCSRPCQLKHAVHMSRSENRNISEESRKKMADNARKNIAKETPEQRKARMEKMHKTRKERGTVQRWKLGLVGEQDPNWKGEEATYNAKHRWIHKHWVKTEHCEMCKQYTPAPPNTRLKFGTQWANISGEYKRIREDWMELCPKCHRNYDLTK